MSEDKYHDINFKNSSEAELDEDVRMYKSKLFQAAKKAQSIFEYIDSNPLVLEEWMKSNIISSCDDLEQVCQSIEYDMAYPVKTESLPPDDLDEESQKQENNYLSNEDKRYPVPQSAENPDQFMGRCVQDANMKNRYPEQSDRFMACMLILNNAPENKNDNPGEKFEDPMSPPETEINVVKPILP